MSDPEAKSTVRLYSYAGDYTAAVRTRCIDIM